MYTLENPARLNSFYICYMFFYYTKQKIKKYFLFFHNWSLKENYLLNISETAVLKQREYILELYVK